MFLQREPFLGVLLVIDRRDAALKWRDTAIVAEVHVMRADRRGQMGVGQAHVTAPHAIRHLVALVAVSLTAGDLLLPGGRGRGHSRTGIELGDGVSMVQL